MIEIVADLSNAHNGDMDRALRLCDAVHSTSATVKFQAYTPDELVQLRGDGPAPVPWAPRTMRDLYTQAQTPLKWFPRLVMHCEEIGLPWFASVFGPGSLALMEALECPRYKLAALDYDQRSLRRMVEATGKPIIRSTPHLTKPAGATTLWCPPGYPQTAHDLTAGLKVHDGFSYHGTDSSIPLAAVALGAQMIEVHVQMDDEPSVLEPQVSLTITQLEGLVDDARAIQGAL